MYEWATSGCAGSYADGMRLARPRNCSIIPESGRTTVTPTHRMALNWTLPLSNRNERLGQGRLELTLSNRQPAQHPHSQEADRQSSVGRSGFHQAIGCEGSLTHKNLFGALNRTTCLLMVAPRKGNRAVIYDDVLGSKM